MNVVRYIWAPAAVLASASMGLCAMAVQQRNHVSASQTCHPRETARSPVAPLELQTTNTPCGTVGGSAACAPNLAGPVDTTLSALEPRPIAPLSLGDVSLLRPTLRWHLPVGSTGALLELCRDRACADMIESIEARGSSVRPARPLPPSSVVFWRLRARVGNTTGVLFSPTWLFHVPARDNSSGVDTSVLAHVDVNGDGFDDLVVGASNADPAGREDAGTVSVYYGSVSGISATPARVLEGAASAEYFGCSVAGAGDVNGDGFGDIVVGALGSSHDGNISAGAARVFYGSGSGLSQLPAQTFHGGSSHEYLGWALATAGDVDRDGFADILVGIPGARVGGRAHVGRVSLFHGSAHGVASTPAQLFEGREEYDEFGHAVASAGDVNGDGFGDLVIGAPTGERAGLEEAGSASVYYGSASGFGAARSKVFEGSSHHGHLGSSVASAGDLNGDGYSDLVVGAFSDTPHGARVTGSARVFHGGPTGLSATPTRVLAGVSSENYFGDSVSTAGDVNGDGFSDLLVGAYLASPAGRSEAGTASVYYGGVRGISLRAARVLAGARSANYFGGAVAGAGDVNGDGFADIFVGACRASPDGRAQAGTAGVYHGRPGNISSTPVRVVEGVAPYDRLGSAIASR